jgi:CRISPR-associated protein Csm5
VHGDRPISSRKGPNTDFMRALQVSDSQPLIEKQVVNRQQKKLLLNMAIASEVVVSSRFPNYQAKYRASIYAEMVRLVDTRFTITLDHEMLTWFRHSQGMRLPFQNIDELLTICQEFAEEQWDYEYDYWQTIQNNLKAQGKSLVFDEVRNFYQSETCPYTLRLGWGSGMIGTTVGLTLEDQLRSQVRDAVGLKAPSFEAPKSRRTIVGSNGEIRYLPGWIKLSS